MTIKKFILSTGDGELEESEVDSSGNRTIAYDDSLQRVQLSKAYVIGNLYVSGSIVGNLTGSVNGSASSGGSATTSTVTFTKSTGVITVGDIVALNQNGLARCNYLDSVLSNAIGVVSFSGSNNIEVQTFGEAEIRIAYGAITTGSVLYVGATGSAVTYDQISSGAYITQVGIFSGNGGMKLIIQPRIFGIKG